MQRCEAEWQKARESESHSKSLDLWGRKMKWMLVLSLVVAIAAFSIPLPWTSSPNFSPAFNVSICLAICWVLLLVAGVLKFRKRGLWLLFGMPFALAWPMWYVLLAAACHSGDCI
jgi:hypothetical protein